MYDLALPSANVRLSPADGEAESFELIDHATVLTLLRTHQFKPNCALVLLDFFVRHGVLTPENERDYAAIVALLHAPLHLPTP